MAIAHTFAPDRTTVEAPVPDTATNLAMVWAFSTSCDAWLQQTDFVDAVEAVNTCAAMNAECGGTLRVAITLATVSPF